MSASRRDDAVEAAGRVRLEDFDPVVHHPVRLGILTVLANVDQATFTYVKDTLDLTDGNLSRHITTLEGTGFLKIEKGYEGRRPRTWLSITRAGQQALDRELEAMRVLQQWRPQP